MSQTYPSMMRRTLATAIDGTTVVLGFIALSHLLPESRGSSFLLRLSVLLVFVFAYEPLLTSRLCTLGQLIMGIRVRNVRSQGRLSVPRAFARIALILLLGSVSFLAIPFGDGRRAVHDYAVGSIVVMEWAVDE